MNAMMTLISWDSHCGFVIVYDRNSFPNFGSQSLKIHQRRMFFVETETDTKILGFRNIFAGETEDSVAYQFVGHLPTCGDGVPVIVYRISV